MGVNFMSQKITDVQKAALILKNMNSSHAQKIFNNLSKEEQKKITLAMQQIDKYDDKTKQDTMNEFIKKTNNKPV